MLNYRKLIHFFILNVSIHLEVLEMGKGEGGRGWDGQLWVWEGNEDERDGEV